jgi:hypothetical protein
MGQVLNRSNEAIEETVRRPCDWHSVNLSEPFAEGRFRVLNVRAVEFIARPGKSAALRDCLRESVLEHLNRRTGFSGAVILSSHKEARLVTVLSFWRTEGEATENSWENSRIVHQILFQLVDVCARVQTYEAAIPTLLAVSASREQLLAC